MPKFPRGALPRVDSPVGISIATYIYIYIYICVCVCVCGCVLCVGGCVWVGDDLYYQLSPPPPHISRSNKT